jgi:hypothetical protein
MDERFLRFENAIVTLSELAAKADQRLGVVTQLVEKSD